MPSIEGGGVEKISYYINYFVKNFQKYHLLHTIITLINYLIKRLNYKC